MSIKFFTMEGGRFIVFAKDITERKKAGDILQNKVEELEKWQKHTIGREVKMVELKKEIKELKEKLKKYESV